MRSRSEPIIYNNVTINSWLLEVDSTPVKVKAGQESITKWFAEKQGLEDGLELIQKQSQVAQNNLQFYKGSMLKNNCNARDLKKLEKKIADHPDIKKNQNEIIAFKLQQERLIIEIGSITDSIIRAQNNIQDLQDRADFLSNKQIPHARKFLSQLQNNPEELFKQILEKVHQTLSEFNDITPDQDSNLRLCLYRFKEKLRILEEHKPNLEEIAANFQDRSAFCNAYQKITLQQETIEDKCLEKSYWQVKFAQLNGFLWDLLARYQFANKSPNLAFVSTLAVLLSGMHIGEDSDLPDDMYTGKVTISHFQALKIKFPRIYAITTDVLVELEKNDYESAQEKLQIYAVSGQEISHLKAGELVRLVDEELKTARTINKSNLLYKDYARILMQAFTMFDALEKNKWGSETDAIFQEFVQAGERLPGRSSPNKKILGAIMGVTGTIVLFGSISATIVTAGGLSLPSAWGITLGTSLLAKGAAFTCGASAFGFSAAGWKLFHNGGNKGISQQVVEYAHTINSDLRKAQL